MIDDKQLFVMRRDFSGGINTRQHGSKITENQVTVLANADISVPGQIRKSLGLTLVEDLGNDEGSGLFGYEPDGGTNLLVATHGQKLETYTGAGTFTERKTNFTDNTETTIIQGQESGEGDVFFATNGTDNWFRFEPGDLSTPQDLGATDNTGSDSPPKSKVGLYYRNRLWVLKEIDGRIGNLWYSTAYPADYSSAFDTRAAGAGYRIPCGAERALVGIRDTGIMVIGSQAIWGINPTLVPAATDKAEKLLDMGCVAGKTVCQVGDDVFFLAPDGVRGVFRTQQDKLQLGVSYPLSFSMREEFDKINWSQISKACAVYFDNKYLLALPTSSSTYNNKVWVYYPATKAWSTLDWNVGAWGKVKFSGEERLYAIASNDGSVYRAFYGTTLNGTAMGLEVEGREEDLGQPLIKKNGGELEVEVRLSEDDTADLNVEVAVDEGAYQSLGTVDFSGSVATKLLLHCDGIDGSTTFTDETGKSVTAVGNAQIDTAQKKFGTASGLFDGTGDYLLLADDQDWFLGTSNFTIDGWIRLNSTTNGKSYTLCRQYVDGTHFWAFWITFSGATPYLEFYCLDGVAVIDLYKDITGAVAINTWYHIAVVRNGNVWNIYMDGVSQNSTTTSVTIPDFAAALTVGGSAAGDSHDGWIDELRISKGTARWTADFTPPTSAYDYNSYSEFLIKRQKFHLDSLGAWRNIKPKFTHTTANSEEVYFYGYSIMTYPEEYESE